MRKSTYTNPYIVITIIIIIVFFFLLSTEQQILQYKKNPVKTATICDPLYDAVERNMNLNLELTVFYN